MKIAIVGAGAIGLLTGAYASLSGAEVTFFTRTEKQAKKLKAEGLFLHKENSVKHLNVSAFTFGEHDFSMFDVTIIAVKQYRLQAVLSTLANTNVTSPLIFMQNGLAQIDAAKNWRHGASAVAVIEQGAMRTAENVVVHTGDGQILYGGLIEVASIIGELSDRLNSVEFRMVELKDWRSVLEKKLIANAVINPLTALFKVKNGMLLKNGSLHKLSKRLFREAHSIFPHLNKEEAWQYVVAIIEKTANNRSSMLSDCEAGRKTEIDAISGYLINQSIQRGIELPNTQFVYDSICAMEEERRRSNG